MATRRSVRGGGRVRSGWRAVVVAPLLALALVGGAGAAVLAQDPAATPAATPAGGVSGPVDPRSTGEGPGLEAEPLIVLLGVIGLGLAAAGGTVLYVRLTRDD